MLELRLGYACINLTLRKNVFCSRSAIVKTVVNMGEKQGVKYLKQLAIQNLKDLLTILVFNEEHGIRFFRITSNLFSHLGNDVLLELWPENKYLNGDIKFSAQLLKEIGEFVRQNDHRVTFHSNPYIQLGAINENVLRKSLFDINTHVKIIKMMGLPFGESVIIVHGGGTYEDKPATLKRIDKLMAKLPDDTRNSLCFENCERHYSPLDLLPICEKWKIPFCYDEFHNSISKDHVDVTDEFIKRVLNTWTIRKSTPKMHLSDQKPNDRFGSHSDYVESIPNWMLDLKIPRLDLMLESKQKDLSVLRLFDKYFVKTTKNNRVYWLLKNKN